MVVAIVAWFGAGLLIVAGAAKLRRPHAAVSAVQLVGLPEHPMVVRLLGAGEVLVGVTALIIGGLALLPLAVVYGVFTVVVLRALVAARNGAGTTSCGCFGQEDEAPLTTLHVVVDASVAVAALAAATLGADGVVTADVATTILVVGLVAIGVVLLRAVLVDLPQVMDAMRRIEAT